MFYHAFNGYMDNAFPLDELRPLSCAGEDTLGGYALTLVREREYPCDFTQFKFLKVGPYFKRCFHGIVSD